MKPTSISKQFSRSLVIIVAIIMLFFCGIAIVFDALHQDIQLKEKLANVTQIAKVSLPNAIWNMDDEAMDELMTALFLDSNIAIISLTGDDHSYLDRRVRPGFERKTPLDLLNPIYFVSTEQAIFHEGREIATLQVVVSRKDMHKKLLINFGSMVVLALLLVAAITVRSIRVTEKIIFKPITQLEKAAANIADGVLETSIEITSNDEIGRLASSFDQMRQSVQQLISKLRVANKELEDYSKTLEHKVEDRTKEIQEKNTQLQSTLKQVEEANNQIMESIQYAKRIQHSLLPSKAEGKKYLPEHFVIWKPRDIVGGDIFATHSFKDGYTIVVIDCTGHGVPGAFMTMIASSCLRSILYDEGCYNDPAEILKKLNVLVKTNLKQDREDALSDDGMDAAICFVSTTEKKLTFSGFVFKVSRPIYTGFPIVSP